MENDCKNEKTSIWQGAGPLSVRFEKAALWAVALHRNQMRKNGDVPYFSHLMRVAGLALDYGASEDVAIAALLHDSVEDCGGLALEAKIRDDFGAQVAEIVLETSDSTVADPTRKAPWRERKENYLARLKTCSKEAALVSGCDKLDNATSLTRALLVRNVGIVSKFKGGTDGLLWYYESVACTLKARQIPVAEELRFAILRLKDTLMKVSLN